MSRCPVVSCGSQPSAGIRAGTEAPLAERGNSITNGPAGFTGPRPRTWAHVNT